MTTAAEEEKRYIVCPGCGMNSTGDARDGESGFVAVIKVTILRPLYVVGGNLVSDCDGEELSDEIDPCPRIKCETCDHEFALPTWAAGVYASDLNMITNRTEQVAKEAVAFDKDMRDILDEEQTRGANGKDTKNAG